MVVGQAVVDESCTGATDSANGRTGAAARDSSNGRAGGRRSRHDRERAFLRSPVMMRTILSVASAARPRILDPCRILPLGTSIRCRLRRRSRLRLAYISRWRNARIIPAFAAADGGHSPVIHRPRLAVAVRRLAVVTKPNWGRRRNPSYRRRCRPITGLRLHFTVPNPNYPSQSRRFFQVWLPCKLPRPRQDPGFRPVPRPGPGSRREMGRPADQGGATATRHGNKVLPPRVVPYTSTRCGICHSANVAQSARFGLDVWPLKSDAAEQP